MKRSFWTVIGVILLVIGGLGLISYLSGLNQETSTSTFDDVSIVVFDVSNGELSFATGGAETEVEISATTGFLGGDVTVEQSGDTLDIRHECPLFFGFGCRSSFDITIPAGATISGQTSNGAVSFNSTDGPVDVTTSNGEIDLVDVSSPLVLATSNGEISGTGLASENIDVRTSNGRIDLQFATAPLVVGARTSNGEIEIVLPGDSPPFAVSTSTSNGTVDNSIRTDPAAEITIDAETSNGDITIRYED